MTRGMDEGFIISLAKSRTDVACRSERYTWDEFKQRCSRTRYTNETADEYASMDKDQQGRIKDVGGFVAGGLTDDTRKKENVKARTMITLDLDHTEGTAEEIWRTLVERLPYTLLVYSSHSHTPEKPRLRVVIPIAFPIRAEKYEPIARRIAAMVGIEMFDRVSYNPAQLMYWPSTPKDVEFFYREKEGGLCSPHDILSTYENWRDPAEWPRGQKENQEIGTRAEKAEDPRTKAGAIGAFCRAYEIEEAIDAFLPHVYAPTDNPSRYTYIKGSTSGGLVCYNHLHAYSHHNTDPAGGGHLRNAFDLVRIHKFGHMDGTKSCADHTRLPSYASMCELVQNDPAAKRELLQDARGDFAGVETDEDRTRKDIGGLLEFTGGKNPRPKTTTKNFMLILQNDPKLKGRIWWNELSCRIEHDVMHVQSADGVQCWDAPAAKWTDRDDTELRTYIEAEYKIRNKDMLNDALTSVARANVKHPVKEYLRGLPKWDGTPRLERLIIDLLGAEDNGVNKTMTRKFFVAAVARVMEPGCKFDTCLVLSGPEGVGKSSLAEIMGGEWHSSSVQTLEGKEGLESIRGMWIVELAELRAMLRSSAENTKNFFSTRIDKFRPPYARHVEEYKRQCVFVGTTNDFAPLKSDEDNRRFWTIRIKPELARGGSLTDRLNKLKADRDQLWAEALYYYDRGGELLYLTPDETIELKQAQADFTETDEIEAQLKLFLETLLPEDWDKWPLHRRREFYRGDDPLSAAGTCKRTEFCKVEFICEYLGKDKADREINQLGRHVGKIIRKLPDWEKSTTHAVSIWGVQRCYARVQKEYDEDEDL